MKTTIGTTTPTTIAKVGKAAPLGQGLREWALQPRDTSKGVSGWMASHNFILVQLVDGNTIVMRSGRFQSAKQVPGS